MTRKEFEDRTGITNFTDEYYTDVIEQGYYFTLVDKDAYCKFVATMIGNPLLKEWVGRLRNSSDCNKIYRREQQEDAELMLDIAEKIRNTAEEQAKQLEDRAAERLGRKGMVLYKIARSCEFTADDMDYIKENLR